MGRENGSDDSDGSACWTSSGSEVLDGVGADETGSVLVDEDVDSVDSVVLSAVVAELAELDDEGVAVFRALMTTNCDESLLNVAQVCGFEGNTLNRATPSSQQKARWPSQQKEVSVLVTF